ncbi:sulfur relay protein DsrC [Solemya velum gill symbiont]|uniref:Sulfur relay protein DsrC n=1 Tax=Solemya velum gill symbiont TaxID=2340 RepID=A0A1T2D6F6_SOVGS|nr:sulfur relay protein DsrC [Solemya velum gill symbiont]OOY35927.1 sulfur relay protein DsrC [Solemya velum gill symbiont]OOY38768.1 sulfur relay protein DsrC [Solemya velum gill symbiont]OOY40696.1 sulfur relay protein DsrC [Solemya velum gill symbiont]OOY42653.1 sulfur relay protein DsrC [Solemya velum gill symbiont]OOY44527.1 sulfur relay protein DsrC [Solemya velum gill symbiont]
MLLLSDIMIANQQFKTFEELEAAVSEIANSGERFFRIDVKPQYFDTPNDWEERLEAAFSTLGR